MGGHWHSMARVGLALAGMAGALSACAPTEPDAAPPRPAMVVRAHPAQAAIQIFSGDVRAREEVALSFRVGGKMARRFVDAGARVRAGEVLAELDPQDLRLQADAARAQLAAVQAELSLAEAELERHTGMLERGLISQSLFDAKKATFTAAQAQAGNARAQLAVMENQRDYARLTAPQDGVIASRLVEAGQVVAAGQSVFVLAADGERDVAIAVPENQMARFTVGTPVMVELWSQPGKHWPGRVRELSPAADPAARTFAARVVFDAPQAAIELGQSARVYAADGGTSALAVPLAAVGGEAGDAYVYVLDPATSTAHRRAVQVLNWGEREASIGEGLSREDWVIAGGVHLIGEGDRLRAVDRDNRAVDLADAP